MHSIRLLSRFAWLAAAGLAVAARAQPAVSAGFDYTTGSYGLNTKTDLSTWNVTAEYQYQGWTARIVTPYERVTSPVGVIIVSGHPRLQKRLNVLNQGKTQTETGLGDVEASLSVDLCHGSDSAWSVSASGFVKLPTADEDKGLGTGKADYGVALDFSRKFDRFVPALGLGYRVVGNPAGADLKNYAYGTVGLGYWVTDDTNLNLTFEIDQRSSATSNVDNELSLGLNHHFAQAWDLELHLLAGLSTAAPDFGCGASLRYSF